MVDDREIRAGVVEDRVVGARVGVASVDGAGV